jgi:hypothetical protein
MKMSEARLNDLVYLTLKRQWFEQMFGEGTSPREADIRVCMNMAVPLTNTKGTMAAILLPDEKAPKSHDAIYEVDPEAVFDACVFYMEDHWCKQKIEDASGNPNAREEFKKDFNEVILPAVLAAKEEDCGG